MASDYQKGRRKRAEKNTAKSRFTLCVAVCFICCAVVFAAAKWDILAPDKIGSIFRLSYADTENFPVDIVGTSVLNDNFVLNDNGLDYISDTTIVRTNLSGEIQYKSLHNFINPILKGKQSKLIAFNAGESSFRIIDGNEEIFRGSQGSAINDCDITASGIYAILSDQTGYLSKLSVYDQNNNLFYSYSFNDFYALGVSINEDGTKAVVGAVNTVDGRLVTKIYLLDFTMTEAEYVYTYYGQTVYEVEFVDKSHCVVLTDSLLTVIDSDKTGKEIPFAFQNKIVTSFDTSYNEGVVFSLARTADGRDCTVISLDCEGNEISEFSSGLKITDISCCNGKIACIASDELKLYTSYGDSMGEWDIGSDSKSVILTKSNLAYLLGVSEIRLLELK